MADKSDSFKGELTEAGFKVKRENDVNVVYAQDGRVLGGWRDDELDQAQKNLLRSIDKATGIDLS